MAIGLTILGSGTSHGVPMIGCDCAVCTSADPRDHRMRVSAVFHLDAQRAESGNACDPNNAPNLLVDCGPELRLQCVARNIRRVDAVLLTHHHADHITGMDDLRRFNWLQRGPIRVYAAPETLGRVRRMFSYCFEDDSEYPSAKPQLEPVRIDGRFELCGVEVTPVPLLHGSLPVLGYRVGRIAYCTDVSRVPEDSLRLLRDLDVLILGALRRRPHPTHFNLEQAVEQAERIGARRTFFTHIAHELPHAATNAELPHGMELAYDGLAVTEEV